MRIEEARYVAELIKSLPVASISTCLNVGSSTRHFREVVKPHIQSEFIQPLEALGIRFVHADMKPGDGVDICGNLFDEETRGQLKQLGVKSLLLNNVLEHVRDKRSLTELCVSLVPSGGYLFVTVPSSYPYHADPIDTMYRPRPNEIAQLFDGTEIVHEAVIESGNAIADIFPSGGSHLFNGLRHTLRLLLPFYRPKAWLQHAHRLLWVGRPYKVSVVILRRI